MLFLNACGHQNDMIPFPTGWVLVNAQLQKQKNAGIITLKAFRSSCGEKPEEILLPVLRNGRVHEIIFIPPDTLHIAWQFDMVEGEVLQQDFSLKPLGYCERMRRMLCRIRGTYVRLTSSERKTLGIRPLTILRDVTDAYRRVTYLRMPASYAWWIRSVDMLTDQDRSSIRNRIKQFPKLPHFHLLIRLQKNTRAEDVMATVSSIQRQLYCSYRISLLLDSPEVSISSDFSELHFSDRAGMQAHQESDWIMIIEAGDSLAEHALFWIASVIVSSPRVLLIYTDDDTVDAFQKRSDPRFKPDWSPELLRSMNYFGNACIFPASLFRSSGAFHAFLHGAGLHELFLMMCAALHDDHIEHIPAILYHSRANNIMQRFEDKQAVENYLKRCGIASRVKNLSDGCFRIRYILPETQPLVSILIPTHNRLDLLQSCIQSILERSTYDNIEIIIIDNRSNDPAVLEFMTVISRQWPVRIVNYDFAFNYSAMNNLAAHHARGDVLCLLNNDTEVITPEWIEEMLGHLSQPKVGVVGAKLIYPDGKVQHGGVVVGPGGCADHLHVGISSHDAGYCKRAIVAQDLSAVTAACMFTWKELYLRLGGLNDKNLPVTFNDIDYCLRVRESGYRVIFTPHALLYHHESVSRGKNRSLKEQKQADREVRYMRRKWQHLMRHDPYYNPNLSYQHPDFSLWHVPRVSRPW